MYVYLATDPSNSVFHKRGQIETREEAEAFSNAMARYGLRVYVGPDIGNAVSPTDVMLRGMVLVPPSKEPEVIYVQAPRPVFKPNGATRGFWSRVFGRS